jgi:hypothetical protein
MPCLQTLSVRFAPQGALVLSAPPGPRERAAPAPTRPHPRKMPSGRVHHGLGAGAACKPDPKYMRARGAGPPRTSNQFGEREPEWYVLPAGTGQPNDPTRPVRRRRTSLHAGYRPGRVRVRRRGVSEHRRARLRAPCSRATPTFGWKRSGAPSTKSPRARNAAEAKRKEEAKRREQAAVVFQSAVIQ